MQRLTDRQVFSSIGLRVMAKLPGDEACEHCQPVMVRSGRKALHRSICSSTLPASLLTPARPGASSGLFCMCNPQQTINMQIHSTD